jgi:hypothetical protein
MRYIKDSTTGANMAQTVHVPTPITDALELRMESAGKRDVPVRIYQQMRVFESDRAELLAALKAYADVLNWDVDEQGIRRVWLEPDGYPRTAYNGFEKARAAIAAATAQ